MGWKGAPICIRVGCIQKTRVVFRFGWFEPIRQHVYVDEFGRGRGLNQSEKVAQQNLQFSGNSSLTPVFISSLLTTLSSPAVESHA